MYILGVNAYHGDSSAALLKDGVLVCAFEEERFNRVKHWAGFPLNSIKACLADQNITLSEIDFITIGRDPKANLLYKSLALMKNRINLKWLAQRLQNSQKVGNIHNDFFKHFPEVDLSKLKSVVKNIEHHRSHLASAFFPSPFQKSALLTIDAFGDFSSCMLGTGDGNKITVFNQVRFPHSIGIFYTAFTQYLGFAHYGDEYKVMGLAPYGKPVYTDNQLRKILQTTHDGLFQLNLRLLHTSPYSWRKNQHIFENNDPSPTVFFIRIIWMDTDFRSAQSQRRRADSAITVI
jgi:carbamoyltransferase